MMTGIQWFYFALIFLCAVVGGFLPLTRPRHLTLEDGFPRSEAFASGVFLALSLTMMLPSSFSVFQKAFPDLNFPIASLIAIVAFLVLLAIEHWSGHLVDHQKELARSSVHKECDSGHSDRMIEVEANSKVPASIPIIMTGMISAPSFFLGAALGISDSVSATLIFIAVILHKGTAAFALALTMVRSTLSQPKVWCLFLLFAISTPLGIIAGSEIAQMQAESALLIKGIVLALGAGTFLYMGTLHEMKRASLIEHCCRPSCFVAMLVGLAVTTLVRLVIGEAHRF